MLSNYQFLKTVLFYEVTVLVQFDLVIKLSVPIPVAARSKAWVYGHSLARIVGSNPA
jgi:hypothetical protein